MKRECPYCEELKETTDVRQRWDYAGQAAGIMCEKCWETSGLNPAKMTKNKDKAKVINFQKKLDKTPIG